MLMGWGILGLALLALWIYCIVDVISTDDVLIRNMPKPLWLLIVILLPTIGSLVWLALGRPAGAASGRAATPRPRSARPIARGPEDSPEFMSGIDRRTRELTQWEEDLKRREDELRKRNDEEP
jgi:type VI protein secretion system component VasK